MPTDLVLPQQVNREAWLQAAVPELADLIDARTDLTLNRDVRVSVGWPGGRSVNKVIGQCWPTALGSGFAHVFVSPLLTDRVKVLDVLLHELVHAADDCTSGHKGDFARACRNLGLKGKPTATFAEPGTELHATLEGIAQGLGPYPHVGIKPGAKLTKTQSTRMVKCFCEECGYTVRTTRKWLDITEPVCPNEQCKDYCLPMIVEN